MSADPRNPDLKVLFVRAPQDLVARLDRWRGGQPDVPNRSDAIRRILDERLKADGVARPRPRRVG
jgi:metal-responsive CopG/Arc/MetJ family transcriptional regulator